MTEKEFLSLLRYIPLVEAIAKDLIGDILKSSLNSRKGNSRKGRRLDSKDIVKTVGTLALADSQGWSINTLYAELVEEPIWRTCCKLSRSSIPPRRTLSSRAKHPHVIMLKEKVYEEIRELFGGFESLQDFLFEPSNWERTTEGRII